MVLLHLFDESQTRLADFGYIPECKSKNFERSNRDIVAFRETDHFMALNLVRPECTKHTKLLNFKSCDSRQ